ncbi:hypothetical protein FNX44_009955 [Streptomyces sp. OF1]|uniref:SUKH-4 family immunity protein n=2 Tax=Streptomyces alkaliterrae TaxID=2213162 RepID=A0A5P0YRX1_9ACTN|nr:hypothetical protein [Streptomyces alkaliterrae]
MSGCDRLTSHSQRRGGVGMASLGETDVLAHLDRWAGGDVEGARGGLLCLDGGLAVGKTSLLRQWAAERSDTLLLDAADSTAEEFFGRLVDAFEVPCEPRERNAESYAGVLRRAGTTRTVVVTNAQWAGAVRTSGEPLRLLTCGLASLANAWRKTGVRFLVEIDSSVGLLAGLRAPVIRWTGTVGRRGADLPAESSPTEIQALRVLAAAERRTVTFDEWAGLCRLVVLSAEVDDLRALSTQADELLEIDRTRDHVRFCWEWQVQAIRQSTYGEDGERLTVALTEGLLREGQDGTSVLAGYVAEALPAHAARVGRYAEVVSEPWVLAGCSANALVEPLPAAFPGGVPAGSVLADLHTLSTKGADRCAHGEWLSFLHHAAVSRGDHALAEALVEHAPVPLPWRTIWSRWRVPGMYRVSVDFPTHVRQVSPAPSGQHALSTDDRGQIRAWRVDDGGEVSVTEAEAAATSNLRSIPAFNADADYAWVALSDPGTGQTLAKLRTHGVEIFDGAAAIGDIVVMGGTQGLYAVKVDLEEAARAATEDPGQAVSPLTTLAPRDFEPEWRSPSTELLTTVLGEGNVTVLQPDLVPAGVLDVLARRQLTEVGLPTVDNWFGLSVFSPSDRALTEVDWHRHHGATPPQDSGPLYEFGEWLGGVLCLDGASGRVLRVAGTAAPDAAEPADPVVGTSLSSFVAMVTLYRAILSAYESAAGDGEYLLAQLRRWLPEIDATAAASPVWQHAVDQHNFDAL